MRILFVFITGVAIVFMTSCSSDHGKANVTAAPSGLSSLPAGQTSTDVATPATVVPTAGGVTTTSPTANPTQPPVPASPAPTPDPQLADDQGALILAYLRSNFADTSWLGTIQQIDVRGGQAFVPTKITPDGRGETIARQICSAVLGNDRVRLSTVTVGGAGGSTAATCQH